jgi:hypothetical protein
MAFTGPLEDRIAIRELLETYADAVCHVDAEGWGATWAEDGTWEMPDYPQFGRVSGRWLFKSCVFRNIHRQLP